MRVLRLSAYLLSGGSAKPHWSQLVALSSFFATSMFITSYYNDTYQKIVDLTSLLEYYAARVLDEEGFWSTKEKEREKRLLLLQQQQQRLESCWSAALAAATEAKDFNSLKGPLRAFSLSFTSNNLSGNWGDYVNRQDNKNAIMRPSRPMFTDVFIPPTK
ncbi:hypothetical protein, conserved [Eimeria maxima]|uniref:Uncharacterized protein n=1 Tax=Eimeria maxima TaxID=5804 RepID=U6MF55_EIMMA|nr:hypothetical protein, conserved [Eimeria maxima]CDJ61683.1 hypothetical protein, conserved [Eimeria maxima]